MPRQCERAWRGSHARATGPFLACVVWCVGSCMLRCACCSNGRGATRCHRPAFLVPSCRCVPARTPVLGCASLACLKGVPRAVHSSPVRAGCVGSAHLPERRVCVHRCPWHQVSSGTRARVRACVYGHTTQSASRPARMISAGPSLPSPRAPLPHALTPPHVTSEWVSAPEQCH